MEYVVIMCLVNSRRSASGTSLPPLGQTLENRAVKV